MMQASLLVQELVQGLVQGLVQALVLTPAKARAFLGSVKWLELAKRASCRCVEA